MRWWFACVLVSCQTTRPPPPPPTVVPVPPAIDAGLDVEDVHVAPLPDRLSTDASIDARMIGYTPDKSITLSCSSADGSMKSLDPTAIAKSSCKPKPGARLVVRLGKGIVLREAMDEKSSDCVAKLLDVSSLGLDPALSWDCYVAFP